MFKLEHFLIDNKKIQVFKKVLYTDIRKKRDKQISLQFIFLSSKCLFIFLITVLTSFYGILYQVFLTF